MIETTKRESRFLRVQTADNRTHIERQISEEVD